jgi:hypothetical protein
LVTVNAERNGLSASFPEIHVWRMKDGRVQVARRDAMEFLTKYIYDVNWKYEVKEQFGVFTLADWVRATTLTRPFDMAAVIGSGLVLTYTTTGIFNFAQGAIGSHLENLQRKGGFKGFNQKSVSVIIQATDPRGA